MEAMNDFPGRSVLVERDRGQRFELAVSEYGRCCGNAHQQRGEMFESSHAVTWGPLVGRIERNVLFILVLTTFDGAKLLQHIGHHVTALGIEFVKFEARAADAAWESIVGVVSVAVLDRGADAAR